MIWIVPLSVVGGLVALATLALLASYSETMKELLGRLPWIFAPSGAFMVVLVVTGATLLALAGGIISLPGSIWRAVVRLKLSFVKRLGGGEVSIN